MEDLSYIISLGFSGSDIWRAVIISFFAAMMVGKKRKIFTIALWALLIDRLVWPLIDMALSGAADSSISGAVNGMFQAFTTDMAIYVVRYMGLVVMIAIFAFIRRRIHSKKPSHKNKPQQSHAY